MQAEWDIAKSASNKRKHGISFNEALALWESPVLEVAAECVDETRWLAVGVIGGRYWSAVNTLRHGRMRLISVRRARNDEKEAYLRENL